MKPRKHRDMPKGPNGETVYDRIMPHPGDGGPGKGAPRTEREMYAVEYAGVKIIYDINNI